MGGRRKREGGRGNGKLEEGGGRGGREEVSPGWS